jgi:cell division transport system permease protein
MTGAYFLREALRQAWRQRLLSLVAVSSLGLAALLAGAWALLWLNSRHWEARLGEAAELCVYLRPGLPAAEQSAALTAARALSGVASAVLVSEAEAAAELGRDPELRKALELLGENPLPATIKVRLSRPEARDLSAVQEALGKLPGVEEVDSGRGAVENLVKASRAAKTVFLGVGVLFSVAALLIVAAVLRLAAWTRRRELGIMRLVGAGHGFIRAPFLLEGLLQGLLGGGLAASGLAASLAWLGGNLRSQLQIDLQAFLPRGMDPLFSIGLVAATGLLGLLGAGLALATVTLAYEAEDEEP